MDTFKEYISLFEAKDPNFCYMLFLESPFIEQIQAIQENLPIDAETLIKPEQFHCTVRYCKLAGEQTPDLFLNWLGQQELPVLEAFTQNFAMFDDGALVMELDSPQLREWEAKINGWLTTSGGYAPSEYPTYKPHISLAYGVNTKVPDFDIRQHRMNVKFTIHRVTNQNKDSIFEKKVQNYKGLQYGLIS